MLLMVNVSGKTYLIDTEDDQKLTENEGKMSKGKGCLKAKKDMCRLVFHSDYIEEKIWALGETSAEFDARALKMGFPMHWIIKRNLLKKRCASKKKVLYSSYCRKWLRVNW